MGRTWLVTHEFFDFEFSSCTLPIMKELLGEPGLLLNQSLIREQQSPRQQNGGFSLILHLFELRNPSFWTWLLREPCCLPACLRSKRRNKRRNVSHNFHITRPLKSPGSTIRSVNAQKAATNMDSCFATMCFMKRHTVREGIFGGSVTLTFLFTRGLEIMLNIQV